MARKAELCLLPTELQDLIVFNLHPSAAIALKQTNHWFNTNISLHRLNKRRVREFIHERENKPQNEHLHACYLCFSLKPETAFTTQQFGTKFGRDLHGRCWGRYCLDCGFRNGHYRPGISEQLAGPPRKRGIHCGLCMSVRTYFCHKCLYCWECINHARTWIGTDARHSQPATGYLCLEHINRCLSPPVVC